MAGWILSLSESSGLCVIVIFQQKTEDDEACLTRMPAAVAPCFASSSSPSPLRPGLQVASD